MIKTLKYKNKLLELSKDKEEIIKYSLEIYTIILGYFARQKDFYAPIPSLFKNEETIDYAHKKIKELLKTNYNIIGINDNSFDSFKIFIKNFRNENNKEICDLLYKNFRDAYQYYDYYHNKYNSFFDYVLLHKHERLEYKLKKFVK